MTASRSLRQIGCMNQRAGVLQWARENIEKNSKKGILYNHSKLDALPGRASVGVLPAKISSGKNLTTIPMQGRISES
jgi:hypothetical protein